MEALDDSEIDDTVRSVSHVKYIIELYEYQIQSACNFKSMLIIRSVSHVKYIIELYEYLIQSACNFKSMLIISNRQSNCNFSTA